MNMQNQIVEYSQAAMDEHQKRIARFEALFNPRMVRVDEEIKTYGILMLGSHSDSLVNIVNSMNPRVKTPGGVLAVNGVYHMVTYNIRHDIWKYWKGINFGEPLPQIDIMGYINECLQRHGIEPVSTGVRGSRITSRNDGVYAFGFGSQIAAYVYLADSEMPAEAIDNLQRNSVKVDYHGSTYYVKVPHALEANREPSSYQAFAYGLVPLIHAYRSASDN